VQQGASPVVVAKASTKLKAKVRGNQASAEGAAPAEEAALASVDEVVPEAETSPAVETGPTDAPVNVTTSVDGDGTAAADEARAEQEEAAVAPAEESGGWFTWGTTTPVVVEKAATKLQANVRGSQARAEVKEIIQDRKENNAATKLQAQVRGRASREEVREMKAEMEQGSLKIQAVFRGRKSNPNIIIGDKSRNSYLDDSIHI
jgi:hypothetical protein